MAFELTDDKQDIRIEHFYSPVIEAIALLSSYLQPNHHPFAHKDHLCLEQELGEKTRSFLQEWRNRTNWDLMHLFSFMLPCPYYHDTQLFIDAIGRLKNAEYLYHFFFEWIRIEEIEAALKNPARVGAFVELAPWIFEENQAFAAEFFAEISTYRRKLSDCLIEIANTCFFRSKIQELQTFIQDVITQIKGIHLDPLPLAQHIMGKTFRRISEYTHYLFVPSYYLSPHKIRIFDLKTCLVIYGCATPQRNIHEEGKHLEKKLKILSDRNRLMILRMLRNHKEYGAKLAEYLDVTTATVSHHLEMLKQAELVNEEKIGNIKYFSLNHKNFDAFIQEIKRFVQE
jgi:DNA-binding transcriptional ArsR family regulator